MKFILGIGNPGAQYRHTRHNLGWEVLDLLAKRHGLEVSRKRWNAEIGEWRHASGPVLLIRPLSYVNLSGEVAQAACAFHKVPPADLLVVTDDIHLPTGSLRLRPDGSAGGHNGLKNIEQHLGQGYHRLRLGCGPIPPGTEQIGFVLGGFPPEEVPVAQAMVARAAEACEAWLDGGAAVACRFNGPGIKPVPAKPVPAKPTAINPAPGPVAPPVPNPEG